MAVHCVRRGMRLDVLRPGALLQQAVSDGGPSGASVRMHEPVKENSEQMKRVGLVAGAWSCGGQWAVADEQQRRQARWFLEHSFERDADEQGAARAKEQQAMAVLFDEMKDADENFAAGFLTELFREADDVAKEYAQLKADPNGRTARMAWLALLLCQSKACMQQVASVLASGELDEGSTELLAAAATAATPQELVDVFMLNGDDLIQVLHGLFAASGNAAILADVVEQAGLFSKATLAEDSPSVVAAFDRGRRARGLLAELAIAHDTVRRALEARPEPHVKELLDSIARRRV